MTCDPRIDPRPGDVQKQEFCNPPPGFVYHPWGEVDQPGYKHLHDWKRVPYSRKVACVSCGLEQK